jgi:hypothetical protein
MTPEMSVTCRARRRARTVALASAALVVVLSACSGSGGVPDQELPGLVVAAAERDPAIDAKKAPTDPEALARAIATPHGKVAAALGAHKVIARSKVDVVEGTGAVQTVESIATDVTIEMAADGTYHATLDNSADYGRETFFVRGGGAADASAGTLYLRPRYGRWHQRAPNDDGEAGKIVDDLASELPGHYELLARAVDVADKGAVTEAGRPAHAIALTLAKEPRKPAAQTLSQKAWRDTAVVEAASGEVVIDDKTGAVLRAQISGQVAFARDGRRFTMKLEARHQTEPLAAAPTFALPAAEDVVATPERLREVDDRDLLLEGMAPQARRKVTP